jgi:hypothetical protein
MILCKCPFLLFRDLIFSIFLQKLISGTICPRFACFREFPEKVSLYLYLFVPGVPGIVTLKEKNTEPLIF